MANNYEEFIDLLGNTHEERLLKAIDRLEKQIIGEANKLPTKKGKLFDAQYAIKIRSNLRAFMQKEYLGSVHESVLEYAQAEESILEMINDQIDVPLELQRVDKEVIQSLQKMSFQGFQDHAGTVLDELADVVYTSTVTGSDTASVILSLQSKLDKRLRRHAGQMAHDSLAQFDATLLKRFGEKAGAEYWEYFGTIINTSRQWCKDHLHRVMSETEIREEWATHWEGKAEGDPFIVRGGFNCRHRWRPVFDVPEKEVITKEKPKKKRRTWKTDL